MTTTIARGKQTAPCRTCEIVYVGGYDEDYRIKFCPLHAAAPLLLAACKKAVFRVDPERPRVIFPTNGSTMQALEEAITTAEGGHQP